MRNIDLIVIHCTATRANQRLTEMMLDHYHRSLGYRCCGYHYYIRREGNVIKMRPPEMAGAHARGYNARSIGIAYEGGLDQRGNPADTRTAEQCASLRRLVGELLNLFPSARVAGHRDLSPDLNGDGRISPGEWTKQCPCFDVGTEL